MKKPIAFALSLVLALTLAACSSTPTMDTTTPSKSRSDESETSDSPRPSASSSQTPAISEPPSPSMSPEPPTSEVPTSENSQTQIGGYISDEEVVERAKSAELEGYPGTAFAMAFKEAFERMARSSKDEIRSFMMDINWEYDWISVSDGLEQPPLRENERFVSCFIPFFWIERDPAEVIGDSEANLLIINFIFNTNNNILTPAGGSTTENLSEYTDFESDTYVANADEMAEMLAQTLIAYSIEEDAESPAPATTSAPSASSSPPATSAPPSAPGNASPSPAASTPTPVTSNQSLSEDGMIFSDVRLYPERSAVLVEIENTANLAKYGLVSIACLDKDGLQLKESSISFDINASSSDTLQSDVPEGTVSVEILSATVLDKPESEANAGMGNQVLSEYGVNFTDLTLSPESNSVSVNIENTTRAAKRGLVEIACIDADGFQLERLYISFTVYALSSDTGSNDVPNGTVAVKFLGSAVLDN